MRVVITGGAGFLGSHLCRALMDRGDEVVAIDNLLTGDVGNIGDLFGRPGFTFLNRDVTTYIHVPGAVDAVLHFASPASPADFERIPIPILKVGSLGTHKTLGLAKDKRARYLLASTSEVYGDPQVHPQPETYWGNVNPIGPRGVYDEAKRFAEAMTMAYHRSHGLDVRIVRIFNSILSDEQVLYDDGRELRRERVENLAERLGRNSCELAGYSVPSFGQGGALSVRPAVALVRHPPSGPCFEVRTRYGRTVRVTGDHSLFVQGVRGQPEARPVSDLRIGDHVAIAGRVEVPVRDRLEVSMPEVWTAAGKGPWLLNIRAPGLGIVAYEQRFDLNGAFRTGFPSGAADLKRASWSAVKSCVDRHQIPLGAMQKLGLRIPPSARVRQRTAGHSAEMPAKIVLTDEMLWLLGLYVAEGCRFEAGSKSAFVNLSCDDETLDRAEKIIERDLELHVVRAPSSAARSAAIFVHSKLLLLMLDHLGFGAGEKRIPGWVLGLPLPRLKWFLEGYREGDGLHSGAKFVEARRHEFSTTSESLKDDLVVAFGRFGLVPSVGRYTSKNRRTRERVYTFWRLTLCDVDPWSPLEWDRGVRQDLNARRCGDLVWARVTGINEVEPTQFVYDFSVPGTENFWAGAGVMCHNTFGPQMRPDDGRAVSNFTVQALAGTPITVHGDGSQTRSFCYVDDEVRGILALLDSDHVGPINIGNPDEYTILELAKTVVEVTNSSSEIEFLPLPVDDPAQRRPDISLARRVLGWEPTVGLREGLEPTADWFRRA